MPTLSPQTKTARRVSAALRKAGIPTGYRYAQTGYTTHDGTRITEPGVEITTKGRNALTRQDENLDHVAVYPVVPEPVRFEDEADLAHRLIAVLSAAGFVVRSHRGAVIVNVPLDSAAMAKFIEPADDRAQFEEMTKPTGVTRLSNDQHRELVIECPNRCPADCSTHDDHGHEVAFRKSKVLPPDTSIDYGRTLMERHAAQFPASGPYRLVEYVTTTTRTMEVL